MASNKKGNVPCDGGEQQPGVSLPQYLSSLQGHWSTLKNQRGTQGNDPRGHAGGDLNVFLSPYRARHWREARIEKNGGKGKKGGEICRKNKT